MARITDETKLVAVKQSLIEIIIQDGSTNASIAKVAKKAKVSVGYLYSHYASKDDLINELFDELFNELSLVLIAEMNNSNQLEIVVKGFYSQLIEQVNKDENRILFLLKMITDYSIVISNDMRNKLIEMIDLLKEKFISEISEKVGSEQIYIQILGSILMFINLRKRGVLNEGKITQEDINLLTQMSIKALK